MVRKTVLEELLDEYPGFLDRRPSSNHYKDSMIDSEQLQAIKLNIYKNKLARSIKRPLKIWREQIRPHVYDIKYEINLENIKRVKLYTQSNKTSPTELLQDSGELLEGLNEYNSIYTDETYLDPIPESFYFVEVEDYNGYIFQKGIPENNTLLGDIYDHDGALDVWGVKLQIPRRRYKTNIEPDDYPYTIPPYFIDETEADKDYEERMLEIMQDYQNYPLPSVETKRILGIMPTCQGRWRAVLAGEHVKDEEYNSSVFDFNMSLNDIPKNINYNDLGDVQGIIDRTMPLSKKGYFSVTVDETIEYAMLGLYDSYNLAVILENDPSLLLDYFSFEAEGQLENSALSLNDYFKLAWVNRLESIGILDYVEWTEIARIFYHDTNTDFSLDTLTGCSISGTGASAFVKLTPALSSQSDTPSGQSQSGDGCVWQNPAYLVDGDSETYTYTGPIPSGFVEKHAPVNAGISVSNYSEGRTWNYLNYLKTGETPYALADAGTGWTKWCKVNFGSQLSSLPDNAYITGITVRTNSVTNGDGPYTLQITLSDSDGDFGNAKSKTVNQKIGGVYQWDGILGSPDDTWGLSSDVSKFKSNFSAYVRMNNTVNGSNVLSYVEVRVHWKRSPLRSNTIYTTGLAFTIPSGSQVKGVLVRVKSWCEESDRPLRATITAGGVTKSMDKYLPTTVGNLDFGGSNDLWDGLPSTPGSYNAVSLNFKALTSFLVRLYKVTVYVSHLLQDGTLQTAIITAPADGYSWDKLETVQSIPSQCGENALLYDILRASDDTVLLGNRTPPVDLSGLAYQNLKVKAKLHTDNVIYSPSIDSLKVTALKNRAY